jgi:hypothetical protein
MFQEAGSKQSLFPEHGICFSVPLGLSEVPEVIIGSIPVSIRLQSGSEFLQLFFTPRRLILARIGKRGAGELTGMTLLGKWGAAIEGLFKSPKEARKQKRVKRGFEEMNPEDILRADKDNFGVAYADVVRVELDDTPGLVGMMILTKDDKYEFVTSKDFAFVSKLLREALGDKVEIR